MMNPCIHTMTVKEALETNLEGRNAIRIGHGKWAFESEATPSCTSAGAFELAHCEIANFFTTAPRED